MQETIKPSKSKRFRPCVAELWSFAIPSSSICTCSSNLGHRHDTHSQNFLRIILQTVFATGYDREAGVIALPGESHFSSPEQLMSQQPWPQNGCLPAMEVSRHPDNQVQPSEYHQPARQSQGSGFSPPPDLSVELIRCSGNRIFLLHDSDSRQTLATFPVLND